MKKGEWLFEKFRLQAAMHSEISKIFKKYEKKRSKIISQFNQEIETLGNSGKKITLDVKNQTWKQGGYGTLLNQLQKRAGTAVSDVKKKYMAEINKL